jgi:hypothetical protein
MSGLFDEISKEVGYSKRKVEYPSITEVRTCLEHKSRQDIFNLLMWHRNLAMPETPKQERTLQLIDDGLTHMTL